MLTHPSGMIQRSIPLRQRLLGLGGALIGPSAGQLADASSINTSCCSGGRARTEPRQLP